jgi:hypothetical protein
LRKFGHWQYLLREIEERKMSVPYEGDSQDANVAGLKGTNAATTGGAGVWGSSVAFDGVHGESNSTTHAGVSGINHTSVLGAGDKFLGGPGVFGSSNASDGVHGESNSGASAGVAGINNHSSRLIFVHPGPPQPGGSGVYGRSKDFHGVFGETEGGQSFAGVVGKSNGGGPGVYGFAGNWDAVHGDSESSQHAGVSGINRGGGIGVYGQVTKGGKAGHFEGNVHINGDHNVTGTLNVTTDIILASQAGDCAEDFDVVTSHEVEPGTVMVLDDSGALRPSDQGYDRKVAGVISGAGGLRPGMILGRGDSPEQRVPIALVGKVYCKADADYAPIEVGDLLTTSPTIGHAMKASDPLRAFGAVMGKALRPLRQGKGLVPILIALQ